MNSLVNHYPLVDGCSANAILGCQLPIPSSLSQILGNTLLFDVHFWLICSQPISGRDIYEADDYSVSANNTKPNVGGLCLVLSHKVNVWGIQNLFVAKCLSKLEVNKENVNNAEVSKDSPVKSICQEEVKLLKAVDAGNSGLGNYIGLHFLVSGKELYYGISDSMLYNLILAHQSNCVIPDLNASTLQTQ